MDHELENIRIAMKQTIYQNTIDDIKKEMVHYSDVKSIVTNCLDNICDAANTEAATFWIYKRSSNCIIPYATYGGSELKGITLKPGEGIAGKVIATNQPVFVDDCSKVENWNKQTDSKTGFVTKSMICVPVIFMNNTVGCLQLINHKYNGYFENNDVNHVNKLVSCVIEYIESDSKIVAQITENSDVIQEFIIQQNITSFMNLLKNKDIDDVLDLVKNNNLLVKNDKISMIKIKKALKTLKSFL